MIIVLISIIILVLILWLSNQKNDHSFNNSHFINENSISTEKKLNISSLFDSHEKADLYVLTVYLCALINHTYGKPLDKAKWFENWLYTDQKMIKETMKLFNLFSSSFKKNDSFEIFKTIGKPSHGKYKFVNHEVQLMHEGTYVKGNELLQLCYKAKTILSYSEKINLINLLDRRISSLKGETAIANFALFMGDNRYFKRNRLLMTDYKFPTSKDISKTDIFESTYFLDLHYQKKAPVEVDKTSPNFNDLIHQKHVEEYGEKGNLYHNLNEKLSKKCQSLLKELVDQQIIFDDEMSQKFNSTEITYQRYNKAFQLAHSFGVANILDINRIEGTIENQKAIKKKIILHERLLQEMEEINATLKKLKGTLFEDDKKLKVMLSELDVLTDNLEKYY